MLVHTVIFYLRNDLSEAQKEEFHKGLESLRPIKTAQALYIGKPAAVAPRPVVDSSFSFSITAIFADEEAHNAYQVDPLHVAFLDQFRSYWSRVQIYDAD